MPPLTPISINYDALVNLPALTVVGNSTGSVGPSQAILLGANMSFSSGQLAAFADLGPLSIVGNAHATNNQPAEGLSLSSGQFKFDDTLKLITIHSANAKRLLGAPGPAANQDATWVSIGTGLALSDAGVLSATGGGGGSQDLASVTGLGNTTTTDIEITDATKGAILKAPNGTRYRLTVNNLGQPITTALP